MKCLTDQFQLYFCFCIGNTKQLYFFLHWQTQLTSLILTDILLVAAYALFCLCIPVASAVVEWVFSHVISVFKMWKSCDFECVQDRCQCCVIFACF